MNTLLNSSFYKSSKNLKVVIIKKLIFITFILGLPISINFANSPKSAQFNGIIFPEERIAHLLEEGKNYQDLQDLGYSSQEIAKGVREHIMTHNPIPSVEELKSIGLDENQLLTNTAKLIEDEHLSVYDLDDMGFKQAGLMPELSTVLIHQYHYSKDELEGIGFTHDEISI
jgi:hypothetical protein